MTTAVSTSIQYSGRRGRPDHRKRTEGPRSAPVSMPVNSPVWWMAAMIFAAAALTHGFGVGVAAVIGQLGLMTLMQWAVILYQRRVTSQRMARTIPMLRAARWASFLLVMAAILVV
ncbi:hypothetical protein [Altererythrobacter litoralis]|uniref:Uncharacterized protein n=1 Tax=Altererythrobacter litoralis TaxID=3113904 RepID=A0ABU7GGZ0_9SPHN|nr:hypothetical protein [Erythrobacteraceae bacterium 1XM1-14]